MKYKISAGMLYTQSTFLCLIYFCLGVSIHQLLEEPNVNKHSSTTKEKTAQKTVFLNLNSYYVTFFETFFHRKHISLNEHIYYTHFKKNFAKKRALQFL